MFGASLTCLEFNSWSTRPKLLSGLLQVALDEQKMQRKGLEEQKKPPDFSIHL